MRKRTAIGAIFLAVSACGLGGEADEAEPGNVTSANEVAAQLAAVEVEPGLWESSSEIVSASMPGMPREIAGQMVGRRTSARHCITPEQAARPNANFLTAQQNSDCTYQDFSMRGGRIAGTMICRGGSMPGEVRTRMQGRYGADSYDMRMQMETRIGELPVRMEARTTGRRVGPCGEEQGG